MIYAYRGVDLVVAVMGALKAGATFSVIDPLYPPDRQIIYLKVAQPRALINLAKATQEAGELSDRVRSFIRDNLHLKTEIPALAIRDDGSLLGGNKDGKDVLDQQQALKTRSSGIIIGPDDAPTLSKLGLMFLQVHSWLTVGKVLLQGRKETLKASKASFLEKPCEAK